MKLSGPRGGTATKIRSQACVMKLPFQFLAEIFAGPMALLHVVNIMIGLYSTQRDSVSNWIPKRGWK